MMLSEYEGLFLVPVDLGRRSRYWYRNMRSRSRVRGDFESFTTARAAARRRPRVLQPQERKGRRWRVGCAPDYKAPQPAGFYLLR